MKRLIELFGKLQTQGSDNPRQSPSKAHELYKLPKNTFTPRTVSSLTRQSQVHRLCSQSKDYKPQSTKTTQSMDSLKTTPKTDQTAQEEHRVATKAKTQHMDLSLHKSLGARIQ